MENLEIISKQNNFIFNKHSKNQNKIATVIIAQKTVKKRNPGVDLVRLIGAYNIVLNHFLFIGGGLKIFSKHEKQLNFLHIFTDWHNNGFALISGIVGFRTNRYSNLMHLWLVVFFYSAGIHFYIKHFKKNYVIKYNISIDCFPVIFHRYWYFTAYFGMYLFLPLINKGISCLTKNEFRLVIISTLGIFIFWKDFKNPYEDVFKMREGLSMIWLLTYYIVGAYIGKYPIHFSGIKKFIFNMICFFISFSPIK
jgi:surface polysaccharide O-acyltransferase-like enzyme